MVVQHELLCRTVSLAAPVQTDGARENTSGRRAFNLEMPYHTDFRKYATVRALHPCRTNPNRVVFGAGTDFPLAADRPEVLVVLP